MTGGLVCFLGPYPSRLFDYPQARVLEPKTQREDEWQVMGLVFNLMG